MADLGLMLLVFLLSFLVGYLLISRVPPLLHTPLMSMTNAISAVTILGAVLLFSVTMSLGHKIIGALALVTAAFNLVGGFVITDRMTGMFKTHRDERSGDSGPAGRDRTTAARPRPHCGS